MSQRSRVIIVGAGPAGLGAAYQLAKQRRAAVTVVESSNAVGGIAGGFPLGSPAFTSAAATAFAG